MFVNSNGHQFYNIVDKSIVDTFYNAYGIADFYGIDEDNERIFLPRNKWFAITGEVPVVGNGNALGFSNGTHTGAFAFGTSPDGNHIMSFRDSQSIISLGQDISSFEICQRDYKAIGVTNDPTKSGIEAKLTPNENKYLYYCVGNTVVNDAQIDAGGLVSQMELKANATLDNILPQGKSLASFWAMPSNKYVDLTLGASGSTYTAPANGWVFFSARMQNAGDRIFAYNYGLDETIRAGFLVITQQVNQALAVTIPVKKGDIFKVAYGTYTELLGFRFTYTVGSEGEV